MSRDTCLVCDATDISVLIELPRVPVFCNVAWPTCAEAHEAPVGGIRLGFCAGCGCVFNLDFDPSLVTYTGAYDNSLHFSSQFHEYALDLARRLVDRYGLYGKDIIEIGCGQGEFLALLSDLGSNRGYGFDPAYAGGSVGPGPSERVTVVRSLFSERHREYPADFVCCRHVLEHVEEPKALLATLRRVLGERVGTPVFFEVPDAMATLRESAVWDVIYEHRSYFTQPSLVRVFEECGFEIRDVQHLFGGQYLGIEGVPARAGPRGSAVAAEGLTELRQAASGFAAHYRDKVGGWAATLERFRAERRRVIVWGAGSKGVTFLNALGERGEIEYVVDVNPRKQGKYVAGTGQRIVPPGFLREYRPDVVIVMNPIYRTECEEIAERVGVRPRFVDA